MLFVLDPRGRALLGLKLFQAAAARLGWVVLSSYNTLSDGPPEPNVNAVNAMLAWAQTHPALDPTRLYLAGFSGTARAGLGFAVALRGHVAGRSRARNPVPWRRHKEMFISLLRPLAQPAIGTPKGPVASPFSPMNQGSP